MRVGSMFAGIGGICLGFKQAGAEIVWANEMDHYACRTYRHNFSGAPFLQEMDIKNVDKARIPDIDILAAGFPCQAFSIAGYRRGFDDERGKLIHEVIEVIRTKKPRAIFLENVKNLMSHDNGKTYKDIKKLLNDSGYSVVEKIMNTAEYGNVPQNRERMYIVGFRRHEDGSCPELGRFEFPSRIPLETRIESLIDFDDRKDDVFYYPETHKYYPELDRNMAAYGSEECRSDIYQWRRVYLRKNKNGLCPTLTANMGTGGHNVPLIRDRYGIRKLTPEECLRFQGFPDWYSFPAVSNCQKYKQIGNAVSVPVIRRIAESMIRILDESDAQDAMQFVAVGSGAEPLEGIVLVR